MFRFWSFLCFLIVSISSSAMASDDPAALLAKADMGYGEYLSGECVTCHHQKGLESGIPSITGLEAEGLISIMIAYRNKELDNEVMQLVAGRLDDEQIASLAVYFASLPPAE